METLAAFFVLVTLFSFVVPFYLTGKTFARDQLQRKQARIIAQNELEKRLSQLAVENRSFSNNNYVVKAEVTQVQSLWHISILVCWKNGKSESQCVSLATDHFQSEVLPTLK